ncbi:MAG: sigma-70 family RNA polymerase sigma factor [Saprospiraceae bacterium]
MSNVLHSDEDIIRYLCSGNQRQVEDMTNYLLTQFRGMVISQVKSVNGDLDWDVEDVLHEAIIALIKHIQEGVFQPNKAKISTYFYVIARNTLSKQLRQRSISKDIPFENHTGDDRLIGLNDAERLLQSADVRKRITSALQQLDPICREVLVRFWLEDQSMRDISTALGKSLDMIKQRNRRCLQHLRKLLSPYFKDWFH